MKHGSIFSGIGGFDLAATWMGWENVFNCEKDRFCRRILRHYWPATNHYVDIKKFDATPYRGVVSVLSGGFPCQPFSQAGRRKGTADDRYLWPEMLRIVGEVQPRWVVGENVFGLLNWNRGMVFRQVLTDLETAGYEVWPYVLPACGVGAPHRRDRIWFIAHARCKSWNGGKGTEDGGIDNGKGTGWQKASNIAGGLCTAGIASDSEGNDDRGNGGTMGGQKEETGGDGAKPACKDESASAGRFVADPDSQQRFQGGVHPTGSGETGGLPGHGDAWMARKTWQNFPSQPPVCSGNDGIPRELDRITFSAWRKESLKAYGNAIVPQVAWQLFRAIELIEANDSNF